MAGYVVLLAVLASTSHFLTPQLNHPDSRLQRSFAVATFEQVQYWSSSLVVATTFIARYLIEHNVIVGEE